jgi:hypothetical protein
VLLTVTRRSTAALVVVLAALPAPLTALQAHRAAGSPDVAIAEDVPQDLADLAQATWDRFAAAFPARRDCLAPVAVDGAWELDDRATYDPQRRLVRVRIPATAPSLEGSLVHEFAHHLEFTCRPQRGLRRAFRAAQGLPREARWWHGAAWERTPSEQFAEATTELVLGRRGTHVPVPVTDEAVQVIRDWATAD